MCCVGVLPNDDKSDTATIPYIVSLRIWQV